MDSEYFMDLQVCPWNEFALHRVEKEGEMALIQVKAYTQIKINTEK
jgi:hypothetical protein